MAERCACVARVLGGALLALTSYAALARAETPSLIPAPRVLQPLADETVRVADGSVIEFPKGDADAAWTAGYLRDLVARTRGLKLKVAACDCAGRRTAIVLRRAPDGGKQRDAYSLDAGAGRVEIAASSASGLFYGAATLWQLLTPDEGRGPVSIPAVHIEDEPRFSWRGLLLDSVRHYQSPAIVERLIDAMALHKLNVLQWHLADDQGWRIEIKKYPRLTEVGGWRRPAGAVGTDPATGRPVAYGGFYTQDQVRRIVAYAARRGVTIVPEIEMPGHALSAILAYPELGSGGPPPARLQAAWGVFPYLYNVDDHTFDVLEQILTEVMALFPSPFIHIGGDEAVKDQWKASPQVQARMKALGVTSEDALQSYFTDRISAFLIARGRRPIGWDEILEGGDLPAGVAVMSWHGINGAIAAAKAGHDAVLAPAPTLYFDYRQSERPQEPPGRGTVVSLRDVYAFDPAPASLNDQERGHILGVQANLWTEHVRTDARVEAMIFPRLAAVAEVAWSPAEAKDWDSFARRLPAMFGRYRALGINADDSAMAVSAELDPGPSASQVQVILSTQFGLGQIRYALGGAAPTAASAAYAGPLTLASPTRLRAAAFIDGKALTAPLDIVADAVGARRRASQQLKQCGGKLTLNQEQDAPYHGRRAVFLIDVLQPCWIYPQADLTGVSRITVAVGKLPFPIGAEHNRVPLLAPSTPDGDLQIRQDGCAGPVIAQLDLAPAARNPTVTALTARITPETGRHDLCFMFRSRSIDPMWAIDWVQLDLAASRAKARA